MIGKISGTVDYIRNNYAVISVSGVGYRVYVTEVTLGQLAKAQSAELYIHTYVREDQLSLFGFFTLEELEMFELLIGISGIGPKAAIGLLTIASPQTIKSAIINEDPSVLTRVSGVGKKTAERVILELKTKIDGLAAINVEQVTEDQEVFGALMEMGYKASEAREAVKSLPKGVKDVAEKIKIALKGMKK